MPEFHGRWCCRSSKGWVVTVDDNSNVHLSNPLSKTQIQLPSLDKFTHPQMSCEPEKPRDYRYMCKTALSANPISTPDYVVATLVTNCSRLAFYKSGDEGWTTLKNEWGPYEDVIYYKGQFHCLSNWGVVVACDLASRDLPKFTKVSPDTNGRYNKMYLVESSGELLKVVRYYEYHPEYERYLERRQLSLVDKDFDWEGLEWTTRTSCSKVLQLDQNTRKWIEVESLGDQVLFLGLNCSLSLPARDFPQCKGNCIYFTDDYLGKKRSIDNGIYNLEDKSIKPYYPNSPTWIRKPIWVHRNLW
ncbi:F-box protein SKIP23-like [Tasmannia lanceolata]|uniref:F-box protein SKIP23-like n=1 Tax=Tasmannia lanceolata TaxID=3420 RepID=UPI004063EB14